MLNYKYFRDDVEIAKADAVSGDEVRTYKTVETIEYIAPDLSDLTDEEISQLSVEELEAEKVTHSEDVLVSTATYSKPSAPEPYRRITSNAFWNRVGEEKEILLRKMAADALAADDYTLSIRLRKIDNGEFVGLDDKKLNDGFNDLKTAGLFSQDEIDYIFANATINEVPEAQK